MGAYYLFHGVLFFAYVVLLLRVLPVRRVITCRSCRATGWILDLEPDGACPRCGGRRFDARIAQTGIVAAGTLPFVAIRRLDDVSGAELLAQRRAKVDGYQ